MRNGDWIQTYTGRAFWPLDPCDYEVNIVDIAHALAMQCRFGGHCVQFYSVAEHSVNIATELARLGQPAEVCLWGLLHDASEAYLVDLPRPVKKNVPEYSAIEKRVMACVCRVYGLDTQEPGIVKEIDRRMLATEAKQLMRCPPMQWESPAEPLPIRIECWSPGIAKNKFLELFQQLSLEMLK